MTRACRGDRCVLVCGIVSTLGLQAGEVPLRATVSMGVGVLLVRTGASADPTPKDVALMSVSGCGSILAVGMVSVEYGGASARWSNKVTDLK